jgi:large repetitive protein
VTRHSESLTCFLPPCVAQAVATLALATTIVLAAAGPADAASSPVVTKRPRVTGDASEGSRLVASHGAWSGKGTLTYAYQWYRCDTMGRHCHMLRGVATRSHKAGGNDVGHTLSVAVRATDSDGSARAYASLVGPIAGAPPHIDALTQPVIAGSAVQGKTIRVGTGRWRPKPSAFVYQWARCNSELRACKAISGETGQTHAVGAADLGHALVAIVQAKSGAVSRAVFSTASAIAVATAAKPTTPVAPAKPTNPVAPAKPAAPTVGGTGSGPSIKTAPAVAQVLQQGNTLTGSVGSWSGSGDITYTYNWYRCDASGAHCKSIHSATKPTYVQSARDVGHTLGFTVHAADSKGTTTAYAPLLGPVAAAGATLVSTGPPLVTGSAAVGQTLQVSSGSWSEPPSALTYQWQRCNANGRLCTAISGATSSSYAVTADDAGHKLLSVLHATAGTSAQDVLSGATAVIGGAATAGPAGTAAPTVTGTSAQGSQLTGSAGTWSGSGTLSYTYNWFRCDTAGAHCLSIHGATKPTYTLGSKDAGHTLGFAVHAADSSGTATAYAALVGPVAAANAGLASTAQPTISGTAAAGQTLQVTSGSWTQQPSTLAYQWQRCNANGRLCAPIDGATAGSYTVVAADAGHTLLAGVTGTAGSAQQAALSTHTAVVP